jgi:hypothetical protein
MSTGEGTGAVANIGGPGLKMPVRRPRPAMSAPVIADRTMFYLSTLLEN